MMKKKTYLSPEVATTVIVVDSLMLETSPTTITITENAGEGDGSDAASRHYDVWE